MDHFEVVSAFADGERVETQALREALAIEDCREYLIEIVAMRDVVRTQDATVVEPPASRGRLASPAWMGLAAAAMIAVGAGSYFAGRGQARVVPIAVTAPLEADAVMAVEAPPAATEVIRLDAGVASRGGGGRE